MLEMVQEGLDIAIVHKLTIVHLPNNLCIKNWEPKFSRKIALAVPSIKTASISVKLLIDEMENLVESIYE